MQAARATLFFMMLAFLWPTTSQGEEKRLRLMDPPEKVRQELTLSPFYKKCVVLDGLAVVGSNKVNDFALLEAAYVVDQMLAGRGDLRQALIRNKVRVAVMAAGEFTTTIPEHSDLEPAIYWNKRARGLGATQVRPAVSCGEENLLQYRGDPYHGESILVHEFGHAIHEMALKDLDKTFDGRLAAAYDAALREQLWKGTYAATNRSEYWAEGVQSWFDCNRPRDRQHNGVTTRAALKKHDARLAELLAQVFAKNEWRYVLPDQRKETGHLRGFDRERSPIFVWPPELLKAYDELQAKKKNPMPNRKEME